MAVLEIQANGDTAVSKEAIINAGQSLEDPLMRVSLKNTSCPKYTPVQPRKHGDKDKLSHTTLLTLAYTFHLASRFISYHMQIFCSFRVNVSIKHNRNQTQNTEWWSVNWVILYSHVVLRWTQCLVALRRSSPSLVCVTTPSSVLRLTTSCSTESCSRSTPSNCSPPTASSTTSVSFSPPHAKLTPPKSLVSSFNADICLFAKRVLELKQKYVSASCKILNSNS